ncbi:hypothetical protein SCHPADRAFT_496388 [Schizopora paradoxa]|uniref:Uncharacterized protein n=1 Tax=Schizopora paradoxa TaxID=27342 RepID=A0A0H2RG76_9AGAM|nr:hypothetical protein SCHPADRAFT_496388 [Schizopora paradoxa]
MTAEVIGAPKELDGTPSLRLAPRPPFLRIHPSIHLGNRDTTWRCRVISDSHSELTTSRRQTHCCQQEQARQDANSAQKSSRCSLRHSPDSNFAVIGATPLRLELGVELIALQNRDRCRQLAMQSIDRMTSPRH